METPLDYYMQWKDYGSLSKKKFRNFYLFKMVGGGGGNKIYTNSLLGDVVLDSVNKVYRDGYSILD